LIQESLTRDLKCLLWAISLFVTLIDEQHRAPSPRHYAFRGYVRRAIGERPPGAVALPVPLDNEQSPASSCMLVAKLLPSKSIFPTSA
jgi:hypothetical protein